MRFPLILSTLPSTQFCPLDEYTSTCVPTRSRTLIFVLVLGFFVFGELEEEEELAPEAGNE